MLPGEDGIAILKRLRANAATRQIPVVMATAKGTEYDRVVGLDLGADDYLSKPFGMMEMVSRVRAVLRRASPRQEAPTLCCGELTLSDSDHRVLAGSQALTLTLKEFELLKRLMARPGKVFTRDELLTGVWGVQFCGETRTVDVHIRTLRAKLGAYGGCIQTVRGVGYRMEANEP